MKKNYIAQKVVERKRRQIKRRARRRSRKIACRVLGVLCPLFIGFFLGTHHRVIRAYIKGEELPQAPKGHFCHKK